MTKMATLLFVMHGFTEHREDNAEVATAVPMHVRLCLQATESSYADDNVSGTGHISDMTVSGTITW